MKKMIMIALLFAITGLRAENSECKYLLQIGGIGSEEIIDMDVDSNGNTYSLIYAPHLNSIYIGNDLEFKMDNSKPRYAIVISDSLGIPKNITQIGSSIGEYILQSILVNAGKYYITCFDNGKINSRIATIDPSTMDTLYCSNWWYKTYVFKPRIIKDDLYLIKRPIGGSLDIAPLDVLSCLYSGLTERFTISPKIATGSSVPYQRQSYSSYEREGVYINDYSVIDGNIWIYGAYTGSSAVQFGNNHSIISDKAKDYVYYNLNQPYYSRYVNNGYYAKYEHVGEKSVKCLLAHSIHQPSADDASIKSIIVKDNELQLFIKCRNITKIDSNTAVVIGLDTLSYSGGYNFNGFSAICVNPESNSYEHSSFKKVGSWDAYSWISNNAYFAIDNYILSRYLIQENMVENITDSSSILSPSKYRKIIYSKDKIYLTNNFEKAVNLNDTKIISGGSSDGSIICFDLNSNPASVLDSKKQLSIDNNIIDLSNYEGVDTHLVIYNVLGESVLSTYEKFININNLLPGIYFVQLTAGNSYDSFILRR